MRALIVDDSRAMRLILSRIVVGLGFEVQQAGNGLEALEVLNASEDVPELALVDWNMPEMNGLEFIKAVRAEQKWRSMNLMMVTTEAEHGQIVRALAAGAHEYVIKPFTADAIEDKIALLGLYATS